jgi:putative NADH-flavin reductase
MVQLKILPTGAFQAEVYDIKLDENKQIKKSTIDMHTCLKEQDMLDYLSQMSMVDGHDAVIAFHQMEQNGHNIANFGVNGRLVFTVFEGYLQ